MAKKYLDEAGLGSVINRIKADFAKKANTLSGYGIDDAYTKTEADSKIAAAVSSVYKPMGSSAFSDLPGLGGLSVGDVYNVTTAFTTTEQFVEGAGLSFPVGTNICVVEVDGVKKWDVLAGMVDLSEYAKTADFTPISTAEIDALWGESSAAEAADENS